MHDVKWDDVEVKNCPWPRENVWVYITNRGERRRDDAYIRSQGQGWEKNIIIREQGHYNARRKKKSDTDPIRKDA
jgi:hypothetical protein